MYHHNTKNDSAAKLVWLLKDMGVKNNKFVLRLDNELLLDIDPYDPNLTDLEKAMVLQECIDNPWYYIREVVRIPAAGALIPFEFHRGNIALIWCVMNNISAFAVWPRQTYKTTSMQTIYSNLFKYSTIHNKMVFIAQEDAIVKKNLQGLKDILDNLPSFLNFTNKKNRDNEKLLYNADNDNLITCKSPAVNEDAARKSGRGLTTPIQWFDEIAFIKYISFMYDSISFAYTQASKSAKASGSPYHQIMTTTAGFLNTAEGKWAYRVMKNCADFSEKYYDMDIEEVRRLILSTNISGMVDISFQHTDLGKNEFYLDDQRARAANSDNPEDVIDREVLNKWKDISTDHPLGQDRIQRLNSLIKSPLDTLIINDTYLSRVYKDLSTFDTTKPLIGGLDLGGNLKGDYSALTIVDPSDFSVVFVLRTNTQSTTLFSIALVSIMLDIFPGLILVPERNFNAAIIDNVMSVLPNSKVRIYHEKEEKPGIFNTKNIRPILFGALLRNVVDEYGDRILDKTIIGEISGLIRTRNGRVDHRPGEHDDTLMGYLLAMYFIFYIDDKSKYIDTSIIGSDYTKDSMVGDIKQMIKRVDNRENTKIHRTNYGTIDLNNDNGRSLESIADAFYNDSVLGRKVPTTIQSMHDIIEVDEDDEDTTKKEDYNDIDSIDELRKKMKKDKEKGDIALTPVYYDANYSTIGRDKDVFAKVFGW